MLPLLIFAPQLPAFASSAMPFSATPTLSIYLFSEACVEGYPGQFLLKLFRRGVESIV